MKLSRYPDKQLSTAHARAQLTMLLVNATDERLRGMTTIGLAGMYRVPAKEIESQLAAARQRRGV